MHPFNGAIVRRLGVGVGVGAGFVPQPGPALEIRTLDGQLLVSENLGEGMELG